jgi:hypothetical protein
MIPFLTRLSEAGEVLIAGCGGGFDVYAGIPLAVHLLARGAAVTFANLSFSNLWDSSAEKIDAVTWRIGPQAGELAYFPEKWLAEWLSRRSYPAQVYGFAKTGAEPLAAAYRMLLSMHDFDLVLLVDGGTDSLIFGDEPGLGTVVEDAVSVVGAFNAAPDRSMLVCLGFGIDDFHGVSHHSFLENVARVNRDGGYLGSFSLVRQMPEAEAFLDLVGYANQRQPRHRSIVCNSIASALNGEFGDYHATDRTGRTELFINPLMAQYWTFSLDKVVASMKFAGELAQTQTFDEAASVIERVRNGLPIRPRKPIPL